MVEPPEPGNLFKPRRRPFHERYRGHIIVVTLAVLFNVAYYAFAFGLLYLLSFFK